MNREDFEEMLHEANLRQSALLTSKGYQYSGNKDVLSSFKRASKKREGLTALDVWAVLYDKHEMVIDDFLLGGGITIPDYYDKVLESIDDLINYLHLLEVFVREEEKEVKNVCTDDSREVVTMPGSSGSQQTMGEERNRVGPEYVGGENCSCESCRTLSRGAYGR